MLGVDAVVSGLLRIWLAAGVQNVTFSLVCDVGVGCMINRDVVVGGVLTAFGQVLWFGRSIPGRYESCQPSP